MKRDVVKRRAVEEVKDFLSFVGLVASMVLFVGAVHLVWSR